MGPSERQASLVTLGRRIDELCERFELAWKSGALPRLEDYLTKIENQSRDSVLGKLLRVELKQRRERGDSFDRSEYELRFPAHPACVAEVFRTVDRSEAETVAELRQMSVHCPHCHVQISVSYEGDLAAVKCTDCGNQFSVISDFGTSQEAAELQSLGHFELIEKLGSGAFGTVWKACDTTLDRTVAIKIPRAGAMTAEEQEKFFREARAAAQLRHPNIVSVHEVGRDGDTVYIVSDFIRGATLGDWLKDQKLSGREAVELCARIGDALHHAHEQGVVHRDMKPANILIDSDGQPHIMDFGLARREVGEATVTLDGVLMGTPAYMSPEQAAFKSHTADRRSDVYSLGVILFEMLTGERPFRGNMEMIIKQVLHDEPPSPRKLNANISKDLETITLKCLEKDPARRYQSAYELSEEFRRYLTGNTIKARPIGRIARTWRWAKRRPAAAALLVLLVISAVGSGAAFVRERELRHNLAAQKLEADRHKADAELERDAAQAVVEFLTEDVLEKASPERMPDKTVRDMLVKTLIEPAAATVGERFKDQPHVEAAVSNALALTLDSLGRPDLALPHATRALEQSRNTRGEKHADTITSLVNYAAVLQSLGRRQDAARLKKQALDRSREVLGEDHPRTITVLNNYASVLESLGRLQDAALLHKQALEQRRKVLGEDHADTISSLNNYAVALDMLGRSKEAEPLLKQALELRRKVLGEDHPHTVSSLNNYASVLQSLGRAQEAEPLYKQALERRRHVLGEEHPETISSLNNYADVLASLGRLQEAEPLYRQALETHRMVLGEGHPDTIASQHDYASVLQSLGRGPEAESLYRQALEKLRETLGDDHPDTIASLGNYAGVLASLGRAKEAEPLFKQALEQRRKFLGDDHPDTISSLNNYAGLLFSQGRGQEAEPLYKQALEKVCKLLGEDHPYTITSLNNYASVLESLGRAKDAEPLFKQALDQSRKVLGVDHPDTITSVNNYAGVLESLGRTREAEPLYQQALSQRRKLLGDEHPDTIQSLNNYAYIVYSLGRAQDAEPLFKLALRQRRKVLGEDHPDTIALQHDYADVLHQLGRAQDAEPLFRQALERSRKVLGDNHSDTIMLIDDYAAVLKSLGQVQEADSLAKAAQGLHNEPKAEIPRHNQAKDID